MMGVRSRDFEFESFDEAASFGGQVDWFPDRLFNSKKSKISLAYTYQTRDNEKIRNRIGLSGMTRINRNVSILAALHLRPTKSPLRRFIGRMRYITEDLTGFIELGMFEPDAAAGSWFTGFGMPPHERVRFSFEKYFVPGKWGAGLEGTMLLYNDANGYLLGPVISVPYGKLGYRMQLGDLSKSDGPWINLAYSPLMGFEFYANAAMIDYEWEEFEIASDEIINAQFGGRISPVCYRALTISAEYQVYRTPQFTSDRRFLAGLNWKFDSGRMK